MAGTKKCVVITGASGFLGYNLCAFMQGRWNVYGTYLSHPFSVSGCTAVPLDITRGDAVQNAVDRIRPSVIIHAAAISSPDDCEKNPASAQAVNVDGTANILEAARKCSCRVIYISTDMVFDGKKGGYSESDTPNPINFYGATKRAAEMLCGRSSAVCTVVRITLQYGRGNSAHASFTDRLITQLRQGHRVRLFTDQFRSPSFVMDTLRGLESAACRMPPDRLYHLSGPEKIDRYSFGMILASVFHFPDGLLRKAVMDDVALQAPRPRDVSLNGERFCKQFAFKPVSIHEGLKAMAAQARSSM